MNKTPVALFYRRADAEPLQRRLVENGVRAEIHDCKQLPGVKLDVPAQDFERAHDLLIDWDLADGALLNAIRCPECRALRVEYPQYSRKSMLPNLFVGFLIRIHAADKEFYCQDCHFTWPKEPAPTRVRPHSAPYYFIEDAEPSTAATRGEGV